MSAQDAAIALPHVAATYDPEVDALYLRLREGEHGFTQSLAEDIIADFDPKGRLLGIEILGVRRLPLPGDGAGDA